MLQDLTRSQSHTVEPWCKILKFHIQINLMYIHNLRQATLTRAKLDGCREQNLAFKTAAAMNNYFYLIILQYYDDDDDYLGK